MQSHRSAFTVAELIIVIVILAVLSVIAFISVSEYVSRTRDSVRIANLSEVSHSLESFSASFGGKYPEPSGASMVTYSGQTLWIQGTLGDTTVSSIGKVASFKKPVDPSTWAEFAYSKTATDSPAAYQIAAAFESSRGAMRLFPAGIDEAYADSPIGAYVKGNYNGKILRVQTASGSEIITIPSVLLSTSSGAIIQPGLAMSGFVVDGLGNLPSGYGTASIDTFSYAPVVLTSSSGCSISTQSGMIDFAKSLKTAYDVEPFRSSSSYQTLISASSDYDFASIGADMMGNSLGCAIVPAITLSPSGSETPAPPAAPPTPTSCSGEDLDFESYASGAKAAGGCLFTETGTATGWTVTTATAAHGIKSLRAPQAITSWPSVSLTWAISYTGIFTSPAKIQFSQKVNANYYTYYQFSIDWIIQVHYTGYNTGGFENYVSELLPPGSHTFTWLVSATSGYGTDAYIDNISFDCVWGGAGCWWDLGFENGDIDPNNGVFSYTGDFSNLPWPRSKQAGKVASGSYSLYSPLSFQLANRTVSGWLMYTATLSSPAKFSFSRRPEIDCNSWYGFYVDGNLLESISCSVATAYSNFTTNILPAGTHTFEWRVRRWTTTTQNTRLFIDNITLVCEGGGTWCGWDTATFEDGNMLPWVDLPLTFESTRWSMPWIREARTAYVASGSYSLRSPAWFSSSSTYQYIRLTYSPVFASNQRFQFVQKISSNCNSSYKFYVDWVSKYSLGCWSTTGYQTFQTDILPPGQHIFKWEMTTSNSSGFNIFFWLDNFTFIP